MSVFVRRVQVPIRFDFSGRGFIAGQGDGLVTVSGVTASRPVVVFDKKSLIPLAKTVSSTDGTYSIAGINANRKVFVVAFDPSGQFNAVIRDNITPATES